jgi:SAM-dependent methyltransferase
VPNVTTCPACNSSDVEGFYEQFDIPMNSMLLLDDATEAQGFPRGDLSLSFCRSCGFISNVLYDHGSSEYSQRYEASQAFSGVFNSFARGLAQRWIDRHDIRNKTVLEIGCDKGDFLALMCELGNNSGIGIDPAAQGVRQEQSSAADRMQFLPEFYGGAAFRGLRADVVVCRHTLEHIPNVREFVSSIREALEDQPETLVLFELPDVLRVLRDLAFWDLYYEHCSYFSLGSLARLFRACGFDVLRLERDFDDQYLLIEAKVSASVPAASAPLAEEDDLGDLRSAIANFRDSIGADVARRRSEIDAVVDAGKTAVVWGGGSKGVSFLTTLGIDEQIRYAVDVNPFKQGKYVAGAGQKVVAPSQLADVRPDLVLVMNPIYLEEISKMVAAMGLDSLVRAV